MNNIYYLTEDSVQMKILWLTNVPLPEASLLMKESSTPFGGWLVNASADLADKTDVELTILFPNENVKKYISFKGKKINYIAFPSINIANNYSIKNNTDLLKILDEVKPDIVHIFGTEYVHSLAMVNVCNCRCVKFVVSIQGLVSICAMHYMANIPARVQSRYSFRDLIKRENLKKRQEKFAKRGLFEIETIKKSRHIIGRTTWDKACTSQINPQAKYYFCNETLREEFYNHVWSFEHCDKYSIFTSQAAYPIKGVHYLLEAMPLILKKYPNTKLYIAGHNPTKSDTLIDRFKRTSYGFYIEELIRKNELRENVIFTGLLDEQKMCERYLKSNIFVCPSSIENSPNSLGEAMILGVPCIASNVGGIPDMLKHKEEGFVYQADAPYMLAYYICEIFKNRELAISFSEKARKHALQTHDKEKNTKQLTDIYNKIIRNPD